MHDPTLNTPVLFLIFNRPETTKKVFSQIKKVRPRYLFIAADGPRENIPGEIELCARTRDIVNQIDWNCEVKLLLREKNLGCKEAISSAINWFFSFAEEGIILEDDCLPDASFFYYCQNLLEYYRTDTRIMMISGMNYLIDSRNSDESYFFSKYYPIWGWATWKRAWNLYDLKMSRWNEVKKRELLKGFYCNNEIITHFERMFDLAHDNKIDTWDIQWVYSCILQNALAIIPGTNLISNIGSQGTHSSSDTSSLFFPVIPLNCDSIVHPEVVMQNYVLDKAIFGEVLKKSSKFSGFISFIRRLHQ